ncbi:MAG: hypothetical protein MK135_16645 [Polyangiaceae bacterium]|nr:hypothetical protein [Polyangiaceae bacterium]
MTSETLLNLFGTLLFLATLVALFLVSKGGLESWRKKPAISLIFVTLSGAVFYKLMALIGLVILPAGLVAAGNYHLFEGTHEVKSCESCHVMKPMVTDMYDPQSDSLAAKHYRNHWINDRQCYTCHSGYGLNGDFAAKMEGYRHMVRYTTGVYQEPIASRTVFDQSSCLNCHANTNGFKKINSHHIAGVLLANNELSCLNCHGVAHPTRLERTPGSDDYLRLMGGLQ